MNFSNLFLLRGTAWMIGAFGGALFIKFITNIALARMLTPELFGIMVIVNSIRTGIDLISDVGIAQNIVHNQNAENPKFYNTAWTIQLIRAALLSFVCLAAAAPVAQFYDAPILMAVLPVAGLYFVTGALGSVALPLLQKRMQFKRLNSFELLQQVISSSAHIFLAYLSPTVWALVLGGLVATAARSLSTYFILPGVRPRLHISKDYAWQIFSFGKWIFISSIIYFLSMNFDRLFFAKVSALEVLGVYGIARALCDMIGTLSIRLNNFIVFPLVAASQTTARNVLRAALINKRLAVLLVGAIGIALLTAVADWVTNTLYDNRYEAAGWMLAVLSVGAWFSIISSLNEATLLGLGKPSYSVFANGLKFAWLVIGLPISFAGFGFPGAVIVIATSEIFRYFPFALGQMRERFSFFLQDVFITLIMISLIGIIMWMRWRFGLGTSFDGMLVLSGPG